MNDRALVKAFWLFHATNPQVYALFKRFTLQVIERGNRCGVDTVVERIRWEAILRVTGGHEFKFSNQYKAFYTRLFHRDHPNHNTYFKLRHPCAADNMWPKKSNE